MRDKPLQFPATITKLSTMSQSIRLNIDTMETLSDEQIGYLIKLVNKTGWFSYNVHQIENEDILDLPPIQKTDHKPPSQRMRAVIYRIWEKENSEKDFNSYYEWYMNLIIDKLKDKLT